MATKLPRPGGLPEGASCTSATRASPPERLAYGVTRIVSKIDYMGDTKDDDRRQCLFNIASEQHGYFTFSQARDCGYRSNLLAHHTRRGTFIHVARGLYRLRDYPSSPREDVMAAWLAAGKDLSVISHETALDLFDLSTVIPSAIDLTVPRSRRNRPRIPGVRIHTSTRPLQPGDVTSRQGFRLTSPTRTILDAAEAGTGPEQIEMATRQAIERGLVIPLVLKERAGERGKRVRDLVAGAVDAVTA